MKTKSNTLEDKKDRLPKEPYFSGRGNHSVFELENICDGYKEYAYCLKIENQKVPELVAALQAVLDYEKRGAIKGEPRIGTGILNQIHLALKKAQ